MIKDSKYRLLNLQIDEGTNISINKDLEDLRNKKNIWISNDIEPFNRLGWINKFESTISVIDKCTKVARDIEQRNPSSIVFIGMGGSIQTAKVIQQYLNSYDKHFTIDTTNPEVIDGMVQQLDLKSTIFIVMSKSGTTLETENLMHFFIKMIKDSGIKNFGGHFISISDKETPLQSFAEKNSFLHILEGSKDVGGRFSSATAFGVLPALIMGIKPEAIMKINDKDEVNKKAIKLTALLLNSIKNKKRILIDLMPELYKWIEQLIAESSGKDGTGIIPLNYAFNGETRNLHDKSATTPIITDRIDKYLDLKITTPILMVGCIKNNINNVFQDMLAWQISVSIACKTLGVFPFDEPDVQSSKINTLKILNDSNQYSDGWIEENISNSSIEEILELFSKKSSKEKLIYINAYTSDFLNNVSDTSCNLRDVTNKMKSKYWHYDYVVGYGPSYLHSTGQLQKGGPKAKFIYLYSDTSDYRDKPMYADLQRIFQSQLIGDFKAIQKLRRTVYIIERSKALKWK